ncbi:MAG: retron system putative HNH endonuclease [Methylococcaceae bacterium]
MKYIIKSKSPFEFEQWKEQYQLTEEDLENSPEIVNWKNLSGKEKTAVWEKLSGDDKKSVKKSLLQEQGYICCYCQKEIEVNKFTIIEHLESRKTSPIKMFNYDNMLACCDGGDEDRANESVKNIPKAQRTPVYCGAKKDNSSLPISPLDTQCENHFKYIKVVSPDNNNKSLVIIQSDTNEGKDAIRILNLDNKSLREMRGEFIDGFIQGISKEEIEELLPIIKNKKEDGHFFPFCIAIETILKTL